MLNATCTWSLCDPIMDCLVGYTSQWDMLPATEGTYEAFLILVQCLMAKLPPNQRTATEGF
jgi:hypothetical protein